MGFGGSADRQQQRLIGAAVIAVSLLATARAQEEGVPTEVSPPAFAPAEVLTQDLPDDACM